LDDVWHPLALNDVMIYVLAGFQIAETQRSSGFPPAYRHPIVSPFVFVDSPFYVETMLLGKSNPIPRKDPSERERFDHIDSGYCGRRIREFRGSYA
jgi:hypothetical protein